MRILLPEPGLVVLVGPSHAIATDFARRHFAAAEIAAPLLAEASGGTADAREASVSAACAWIGHRLDARGLAVVDAARLGAQERSRLLAVAKHHHAPATAILIDRAADAAGGEPPPALAALEAALHRAGLRNVQPIGLQAAEAGVEIVRERPATDRRDEAGPFDIIGDVHGCADELVALLERLGYGVALVGPPGTEDRHAVVEPPPGRRAVLVGDLVDRGPASPDVLRIAMALVESGGGLCVPGNHDAKFLRWLEGRQVRLTHGLDVTVAQLSKEPPAFHARVRGFLDRLASHLWLDGGRLAVAHAGVRADMLGRCAGTVREFCLYGDTGGTSDADGLPIRYHWAADYAGDTAIVYGHTPVAEAAWVGNTLCVDTGCCFGGKLTALRWPEREIVSVPARASFAPARRPFGHPPVRPRPTGPARDET